MRSVNSSKFKFKSMKTYLQEVSHDDMVSFILFKYIKEQIFDTNRRIFFTKVSEEKMI